ncbi:hypothetical protein RM543_17850 [Roseicyclus sp. F158]|uniref:Uncharacterized protein n=1 Tax=Tropicimonas omnivorans TaxID=3075590 RepID=A0ABU3DM00_9RHOB|nr:hypothetical protein [Roseicyclus sp. F158]MDT0684539.1 hypothetical protein [Roseicyclus sp. F158]
MRLIIHIGTPKAGSSSLQVALSVNREVLARNGILYPAIGRATHHTDLAAGLHGADMMRDIDLRRNGGDPRAVEHRTEAAWQSVADQVRRHTPETVILSAENFMSLDDFDTLRRWVGQIAPGAEVTSVAYLRSPVANHEAKISQRLGRTSGVRLPGYLPWHARLVRWRAVGQVHLRDLAAVGDLRVDFLETVQLGLSSIVTMPERNANVSLTGEGCIALHAVLSNAVKRDAASFVEYTRDWRARLARAEAALAGSVPLRHVSVTPAVRWLILDAWHDEALALRADFGFSFDEPELYDRGEIDRCLAETGAHELELVESDLLSRFLSNDLEAAMQLLAHAAQQSERRSDMVHSVKRALRKILRRGGA